MRAARSPTIQIGIIQSIMTRKGRCFENSSTACCPVVAKIMIRANDYICRTQERRTNTLRTAVLPDLRHHEGQQAVELFRNIVLLWSLLDWMNASSLTMPDATLWDLPPPHTTEQSLA